MRQAAGIRNLMTSRSAQDLRLLVEAAVAIVVTWLLLGWTFDRAFTSGDGTIFGVPYTQSALRAGFDWTNHLYRFGVVGGAPMHDLAGTLPLVQVCALLGISATTTANLTTIFIQLCFAFFGIKAAEGLASLWTGEPRRPSATERITAVWLLGFAPVIAWRLAVGHENLLFGLLPFVVGISLLFSAQAQRLSTTALVFGAIAVFHGVSSFGSQLLVYSAVFGLPIAAVAVFATRPRWTWRHTAVVCALVAGVLVAVPRALGMIEYAVGDDASRSIGHTVTYSFGAATWRDWLHSVPWTIANQDLPGLHEKNYPFAPVLLLAIGLWPSRASKRLWWGLAASAALAVLFANNVSPVSDLLLDAISPLRPFRVPARAIMPVVVVLPSIALAAIWSVRTSTPASPRDRQIAWLGSVAGALVIVVGHGHAAIVREALVWIGCGAVILLVRRRSPRLGNAALGATIAVIAALGVTAFDERFPRSALFDPIEHGPRRLHEAVIASDPQLAMPLNRVQIVDARPYDVGTAFAAQLASLDGDFNPPRRFLELLGALRGKPLPSTSVVFRLTRSSMFPVLQQLYNVRHIVHVGADDGAIEALPETPGPAWFPEQIEMIDDAAEMANALSSHGNDLRRSIMASAWLLRADARVPELPLHCTNAKVGHVATDPLGQSAVIDVVLGAPCVLVVATTYVTMLRATARVGQTMRDVPVVPIDVALTGIVVPANATSVTLAPERVIPWWTRVAQLIGLALLVVAVVRRRGDQG